jgi:hypothetical protein
MTYNPDRSHFVVMNDYANQGHEAIVDPALKLADIISRIASRDFGFTDIVAVFEFNPVEGWSRNVTDDICGEAEERAEMAA